MRRTPFPAGRGRRLPVLLSVALALFVAACAGSTDILSSVGGPVGGQQGERTSTDGSAPEPQPVSGPVAGGGDTAAPGARDDALIVRTGHLGLQVEDVDAALASARQAIDDLGGYIGASSRSLVDDGPVATVTYRVPVDRWDEALAALRATAAEVLTEQTDAIEVTAQAVDLDARIKNLRATETALQGVLAKAQKIPDILEVQRQLGDVRGQIEQLVAQRTELGDRAALGTVEVAFGTEVVAVTAATEKWDPASEVDRATATLVDVLQAVASAGIWLAIVWLPILAVVGVVALVAFLALRRARRRPALPPRPEPPATQMAA